MQEVAHGTGAETYMNVKRELSSVGMRTWGSRARSDTNWIRVYLFGTDRGPDNLGMGRHIAAHLQGVSQICFHMVSCFFHACQLCVAGQLMLLDTAHSFYHGAKYFSSVAAVSNTWRPPGTPKRMAAASELLFGDDGGERSRRLPGR
eukprot:2198725-Pyramimonas_sp.AAC.1